MVFQLTKLITLVFALFWCIAGWSADVNSRSGRVDQKRQAESERTEVREQLKELNHDIRSTESAKSRAEEALAQSEWAISTANRKLRDLSLQQQQTEQKIVELEQQYQDLQRQIEQQKAQLSALLRQQYETGNSDRIKLLLSGDNPNRINRDLQYLGYLSQNQNKLINQLRENLAAAEKSKLALSETKQKLDEIASEQQKQKSALEQEKVKRASLIKQLSSKLSAQRKEVGQLKLNEQRLADVVNRLNRLIAEQRKADQAKRRADALAKAEKKSSGKPTSKPIQVTQTPELDTNDNLDVKFDRSEFSRLKGNLRLPVKGELTGKFGSPRGEESVWKGLFIRANEGNDIKSIAAGKVVFAEWLRGFGNLIILDHGSQYMSIYGNNQALLKSTGDAVKTGDVIATVGNSGENGQTGLYFELRFQGKAFNPLNWVRTQ